MASEAEKRIEILKTFADGLVKVVSKSSKIIQQQVDVSALVDLNDREDSASIQSACKLCTCPSCPLPGSRDPNPDFSEAKYQKSPYATTQTFADANSNDVAKSVPAQQMLYKIYSGRCRHACVDIIEKISDKNRATLVQNANNETIEDVLTDDVIKKVAAETVEKLEGTIGDIKNSMVPQKIISNANVKTVSDLFANWGITLKSQISQKIYQTFMDTSALVIKIKGGNYIRNVHVSQVSNGVMAALQKGATGQVDTLESFIRSQSITVSNRVTARSTKVLTDFWTEFKSILIPYMLSFAYLLASMTTMIFFPKKSKWRLSVPLFYGFVFFGIYRFAI